MRRKHPGIATLLVAVLPAMGCFGSSSAGSGGTSFGDAGFDVTIPDGDGSTMDSGSADVGVADVGAGDVAVGDASTGSDTGTSSGSDAAGDLHVTAVAVGASNMCVELPGHTAACCGYDAQGQDGIGSTMTVSTPTAVSGLTGVTAIGASGLTSCAILSDTSVQCWGNNYEGELGVGNITNLQSTTPVAVSGLTGVVALAMGGNHTCALLSGGSVDCWGENTYGQLGNGTTTGPDTSMGGEPCNPTPAPVGNVPTATAVVAGNGHTCALVSGAVWCWGENSSGQLGNGSMGASVPSPASVPGLAGVTALAAGGAHTCALLSGGTVECWGEGGNGELGNGMMSASATPVAVSTITGVTAISSSSALQGQTTCALLTGGAVSCWGLNNGYQLGNGTTTNAASPQAVPGITSATAISAGANGACALLGDGTLRCWGDVGLGLTAQTPQAVSQ
jgi:alpha-tubulin suppressor-like RCC1 family protein